MSSQSYSSISTVRRRGTLHDDIDRSVYTVGQTLASIVNDPRTAGQTGGGFWGLGQEVSQPTQLPPLDSVKYPPVTKADVQRYIDLVHGAYDRFIRDRQSLEAFDAKHQPGNSDAGAGSNQGEPFMAAVQAVPMQFFQEGFFDTWDDFFKQYCKEQSADELYEQIDHLNRNLDVVELQLLREVASRSNSFFQAAASLQHLLGMLGESVGSIRRLRSTLAEADEEMYSTAVSVKALQHRRGNLQATLDITKGLEGVMAAQQALDCMLEAQDYAGALELLDQIKALLEQPALMGLQCVRHLPPRLVDTTAAVERALANEFLSTISNSDVARVVAESASDAEAQPDASISSDGRAVDDTIWHLPPPATERSLSTAVEQLQEKLLPLAVGLYRADRLGATLQQYKANVGDEVKAGVRDAVQQVLPVLLAAAGDMPPLQQQAGSETQLSDQLQMLHHGAFMVLLHAAARVMYSCVDHTVLVRQLLETILSGINAPASQLGSLRKECSAALQVVVDVALGRWVKLLAARSTAHTRLRQYELRQLLDLSEQVASYTESLGARTIGTFRSALQSQCKGLLDSTHARAMNQLQHLLESEQWVAVEVPGSFQAIVDRLVARCGEGAALLDGRGPASSIDGAAAGMSSNTIARRTSCDGISSAAAGAWMLATESSSESHSPMLHVAGKSFHLVNSALMLLKMVDEYMSLYDLMPQFGAEIVHRELELLKLFNSQTCALVLGAGAMRTAGLRSISAKQLALSCQAVAMLATLLPLLRAGSLALVSQPRRALLMPEFDRLLQDLTMHMDEVHSKLVDIMRDRLAAATQALPAEVKAVSSNAVSNGQPSPTIALLVKQLGTLRTVLVPYLLKEEVEFIFGAVARAYSDALSETFEVLMDQDSSCELVVKANALAMLQVFRDLPLDPTRSANYCNRLSTTYTKHFGLPPWDLDKLGDKVKQQQHQQVQQHQQEDAPASPQQRQEQQAHQQQQGDTPPSPQQQQQQQLQQAGQDLPQLQPVQNLHDELHDLQQPREQPLLPQSTNQQQQDQLQEHASEQLPHDLLPGQLQEHLSEQVEQQQQHDLHNPPQVQQLLGQQSEQEPGSLLQSLQQQRQGMQPHLEQHPQQLKNPAVEQHGHSNAYAAACDAAETDLVLQHPEHDEVVQQQQQAGQDNQQQQQEHPGLWQAGSEHQQHQQQVQDQPEPACQVQQHQQGDQRRDQLPAAPQKQHRLHTNEAEHTHSTDDGDCSSEVQQCHTQQQQQMATQAVDGNSSSSAVDQEQQPGSSDESQVPLDPAVDNLSSWVEHHLDEAAPHGAELDTVMRAAAAAAVTAHTRLEPAAAATSAGSADTEASLAATQVAASGSGAHADVAVCAVPAAAQVGVTDAEGDIAATQLAAGDISADSEGTVLEPIAAAPPASAETGNVDLAAAQAAAEGISADAAIVAPIAATTADVADTDVDLAATHAAASSISAKPNLIVSAKDLGMVADGALATLAPAEAPAEAIAGNAAEDAAVELSGAFEAYADGSIASTALGSSSTDGSLPHTAVYGLGGSQDGHHTAASGTATAAVAFMEAAPLPFEYPVAAATAAAGLAQALDLPLGAAAATAAAGNLLNEFDLTSASQSEQQGPQQHAEQVTAQTAEGNTGTPAAAAAPGADLLADWSFDGVTPGSATTAKLDAKGSAAADFNSSSTAAVDAAELPLLRELQQQPSAQDSSLLDMLFDEAELQQQQQQRRQEVSSLHNSTSADAAAEQPGSFAQQHKQQQGSVSGLHCSSTADAAVNQPADEFQELSLVDSPTAAAEDFSNFAGQPLLPEALLAAATGSYADNLYSNGLEGPRGKEQHGEVAQLSAHTDAAGVAHDVAAGSWDPLNAASVQPAAASVEGAQLL